jgi:hypothetical protein
VRCVATGAPLLGIDHDQLESGLSPREEEDVHVGQETGAAQGAGRRYVQLHHAAIFVRPATTTPSTKHEPTRSLPLLLCRFFPLLPCLSASLRAAVSRAPLFPHERLLHRAAHEETRTMATPGRNAGRSR